MSANRLKALQFHRITPKFQFCGTWNTPHQFERFLRLIEQKGVKVVLPGQQEPGVVISFDDGEKSVYDYAFPILKKYRFKALIFLVVDYIGKKNVWDLSLTGGRAKHLSWQEIYEMHDWGIEFGSHTMTHRNLTRLNNSELEFEIFESKRILDEKLGKCDAISFPFNRVTAEIINLAAKAGYKFCFGSDAQNDLLIKKEAIYITDNLFSLKLKIFEKPELLYNYERVKQKIINWFTMATMISKR